jgi:hypothetical protein
MNEFLPTRYDERIDRLTLGIEPIDAVRRVRIASPVELALDATPIDPERALDDIFGLSEATSGLRRVRRRNSCRFVVSTLEQIEDPVVALRFNDPARRFVPRRLRYAVPADPRDRRFRVRRPVLFPGAAYDVDETSTGLRARVTWQSAADSPPVRWARVAATIGGNRVGYAHGDDRGEFLLLLGSAAGGLGGLPAPFRVRITVFAPPTIPPPNNADVFADLPLESHDVPGDLDTVSGGTTLPRISIGGAPAAIYVSSASSARDVTFEFGRLRTDEPKFFMAV